MKHLEPLQDASLKVLSACTRLLAALLLLQHSGRIINTVVTAADLSVLSDTNLSPSWEVGNEVLKNERRNTASLSHRQESRWNPSREGGHRPAKPRDLDGAWIMSLQPHSVGLLIVPRARQSF